MKQMVPDTNLIVRLVVGDVKEQQKQAIDIFRQAEKTKMTLVILPIIVAESCYVLSSYYKKTHDEIADTMESLLSPGWLEIEHRDALRGMWDWYRQGMHFVDSYLLALAKYEKVELLSFDKKLMKRNLV